MTKENNAADIDQRDEAELGEYGYAQELKRDWGLMHNFGISFSIIVCSSLLLSFIFRVADCFCRVSSPA